MYSLGGSREPVTEADLVVIVGSKQHSTKRSSCILFALFILAHLKIYIANTYLSHKGRKDPIEPLRPINSVHYVIKPQDKCVIKIIFLIYQSKHMLWVLKRTISMRRFF